MSAHKSTCRADAHHREEALGARRQATSRARCWQPGRGFADCLALVWATALGNSHSVVVGAPIASTTGVLQFVCTYMYVYMYILHV